MDDPAGIAPLLRSIRSDPEHFAERAMLLATSRLAGPSSDWAAAVEDPAGAEAQLLGDSVRIARVNGAVSGTPFLLALVPAYVAVLWQQARMTMRIAALHGRDPRDPAMAAELLALRGVYPSTASASAGLAALECEPPGRDGRRPVRTWYALARRVLILAGFLEPPEPGRRTGGLRRIASGVAGGLIWIGTWVFPVTFMVLMSWSCERATRKLAARATEFYASAPHTPVSGRPRQTVARMALMFLGVTLPLGLLAAAVYAGEHGARILWLSGAASITGLALAIGLAVAGRR